MYTFNEILTNIASLSDVVQSGISNIVTVGAVGAAASVMSLVLIIGLHFRINRNR